MPALESHIMFMPKHGEFDLSSNEITEEEVENWFNDNELVFQNIVTKSDLYVEIVSIHEI